MMKPLKAALLGMGTVGGGVFAVLQRNRAQIRRRLGRDVEIAMIADLDTARVRTTVGDVPVHISADAHAIATHPDIDVVIELIGGCGVARALVLAAIGAGKHVITANKALLARHGGEIFAAAAARGSMVAYEAAVAGGIPIIKALREGLAANQMEWVAGIINGTTNFILSEMRSKGQDFAGALQQAQRLGYAEADPTFDIEGVDAAHKITLMAAMAFGIPVQFDAVHTEGITALQTADIEYAAQLGYRIKLLGIAKRAQQGMDGIELRVHPCLVPAGHLLANVEGAMNAVVVHGNAVGTTLYCGQGAGAEPTASAVIADLLDIARLHGAAAECRVPPLAFQDSTLAAAAQALPVLPMREVQTSYYLRIRVADQTGVLARIAAILAQGGISIDALLQREAHNAQTDLIVLTHNTREGAMDAALAQIQHLPTVLAPIVRLRKEDLA